MSTQDFKPDAFVIRTSDRDGKSRKSFEYPRTVGALVECPDWKPKAETGGAICVAHIADSGQFVAIRASMVGENGIKPDCWYALSADGEFVEIQEGSH